MSSTLQIANMLPLPSTSSGPEPPTELKPAFVRRLFDEQIQTVMSCAQHVLQSVLAEVQFAREAAQDGVCFEEAIDYGVGVTRHLFDSHLNHI
jgi:hypothetical protein